MNAAYVAIAMLTVALLAYVFTPAKDRTPFTRKSRLDFLEERRDVLYDNLRDLNFEFRAGKYPADDYQLQRELLESEAAALLFEMDAIRHSERAPHAASLRP